MKLSIIIPCKNESKSHSLEINVDGQNNVIEYKCYNFDNVLGTGTNKPIEIGQLGGKKMYIHFWLYAMGGDNGTARKLEYSIWKER